MKRAVFALLSIFLIWTQAFAQITLTQSGYPSSFTSADSVKTTNGNTGIPSLIPATNAMWDFSGTTYTGSNYLTQFTAVPSPETFGTPLTMGSGVMSYQTTNFNKISSTGFTVDADSISYQYISLTPLTAGAYDSFILSNQTNYYSSPDAVIKFPASMDSSWSSNYSYADNFFLTVGSLSLSHAPGQFKYTFTETDTVVGWGKMKVKNIDGSISGHMDVLQVKRVVNKVDSFFLGGSPASSVLLTFLGVTQGQAHNSFQYRFYRAGEVTPLAEALYPTSSFVIPDSAYIHTQRLATATSVSLFKINDDIKVYPNPVSENTISIDLPFAANAKWSYELINISGKNVASGLLPLTTNQTHTAIIFPNALAVGTFYLCLKSNGQLVSVKQVSKTE